VTAEERAFERDTVGFTPDEGRAWQRGWKACEEAQQAELERLRERVKKNLKGARASARMESDSSVRYWCMEAQAETLEWVLSQLSIEEPPVVSPTEEQSPA
jgi:hypothetical protein